MHPFLLCLAAIAVLWFCPHLAYQYSRLGMRYRYWKWEQIRKAEYAKFQRDPHAYVRGVMLQIEAEDAKHIVKHDQAAPKGTGPEDLA